LNHLSTLRRVVYQASLTMSALSSTFWAYYAVALRRARHFALSWRFCRTNQGSLV